MKPNKPLDIWKFISKGEDDKCWPYIGGTFSKRYGRFSLKGIPKLAHRHVYEITNGEIAAGLYVMHKCNNKLCCNPRHLTLGTNSQNQRHASASGAFKRGRSGAVGVCMDKKGYWCAYIYHEGKQMHLYHGTSFDIAFARRKEAEDKYDINFN